MRNQRRWQRRCFLTLHQRRITFVRFSSRVLQEELHSCFPKCVQYITSYRWQMEPTHFSQAFVFFQYPSFSGTSWMLSNPSSQIEELFLWYIDNLFLSIFSQSSCPPFASAGFLPTSHCPNRVPIHGHKRSEVNTCVKGAYDISMFANCKEGK